MPRQALVILTLMALASAVQRGHAAGVAISPQYDTAHVYVAPEDFDRFADSLVATFGGTKTRQGVSQVTPTPSQTISQLVLTPSGSISVFGFKTPIPYPFGTERTGYLVKEMDAAVRSARQHGADVVVENFPDPVGRDAVIEWPGGVHMQLYWHTTQPNYPALKTIPENRVYVSTNSADTFVKDFVGFSGGRIVLDDRRAPGVEVGRPGDFYHSILIESDFGKINVLATRGWIPYPYGRETTGYEVQGLADTLEKAKAAGATVLVAPFTSRARNSALVKFPGGYIAEIHSRIGQ